MVIDDIVTINLRILERLKKCEATLDDLAKAAKCKEGYLVTPIKMLLEQELIEKNGDRYRIGKLARDSKLLPLMSKWLKYFEAEFYEIAKDVAKVIHEKSLESHHIQDVMLYGSTLKGESPRDIDLLIIHQSEGDPPLRYSNPYREEECWLDEAVGQDNSRLNAFGIFQELRYRHESSESNSVVVAVGNRIKPMGIGRSFSQEEIDDCIRLGSEKQGFNVAYWLDLNGINKIFDVNVLHLGAFTSNKQYGDEQFPDTSEDIRKRILLQSKDHTFWHRILSYGKLYDIRRHDFTIPTAKKYPEALKLLPSE